MGTDSLTQSAPKGLKNLTFFNQGACPHDMEWVFRCAKKLLDGVSIASPKKISTKIVGVGITSPYNIITEDLQVKLKIIYDNDDYENNPKIIRFSIQINKDITMPLEFTKSGTFIINRDKLFGYKNVVKIIQLFGRTEESQKETEAVVNRNVTFWEFDVGDFLIDAFFRNLYNFFVFKRKKRKGKAAKIKITYSSSHDLLLKLSPQSINHELVPQDK